MISQIITHGSFPLLEGKTVDLEFDDVGFQSITILRLQDVAPCLGSQNRLAVEARRPGNRVKDDLDRVIARSVLVQQYGIRIGVNGIEIFSKRVGKQLDAFTGRILLAAGFQSDLFVLAELARKSKELNRLAPEPGMKLITHFTTQTPEVIGSDVHRLAFPISLPSHQRVWLGSRIISRTGKQNGCPRLGSQSINVAHRADHSPYPVIGFLFRMKGYHRAFKPIGGNDRIGTAMIPLPARRIHLNRQNVGDRRVEVT